MRSERVRGLRRAPNNLKEMNQKGFGMVSIRIFNVFPLYFHYFSQFVESQFVSFRA